MHVSILKAMTDNRKQQIQADELLNYLAASDWLGSLKKYCL